MSSNITETDKIEDSITSIPHLLSENLSTIACYAGIELEDYKLNRGRGFYAANRLLSMLENSLISCRPSTERKNHLSYSVALGMWNTLKDIQPSLEEELYTVDDLITESEKYTKNLQIAIESPHKLSQEELERLSTFCLRLSRKVRGLRDPLEDRERRDLYGQ